MPQLAETIFRDFTTDGIPASGGHEPRKVEIREWGTWLEGFANAVGANGGLVYATKALLDADLAHPANTSAWVIGDSTAANNGIYRKSSGSGSGSWTRVADLPYSFIKASDTGAGTPNAIQATTSIPVPSADGAALIALNIFETNTGSPVTVSFNGGAALTVKTNSGNDIAAGGLAAGMIVVGYKSGSTFRLLSDQASAALLAAVEAAANRAEEARDAALAAVPSVFPSTIAELKAVNTNAFTRAYLTDPVRVGQFIFRTGDFSAEVAADAAEGIYIKADAVAATAGAWVRSKETYSVLMFGADPTGTLPSNAAFSIAAKVAPAQHEVEGSRRNFPAADIAHVRIPPGVFEITELLDVGGREIYWILEPGARVIGTDFLNGHVIRHDGSVINKAQPYGIIYGAVGGAAMIRSSLDDVPEITGLSDVSELGAYPTRDAVAFFAQGESPPALVTVENPTYSATRITPPVPLSADVVKRLRRGMIIDTVGSPIYSGAISTWAEDGSWVEVVDGWFEVTGAITAPTTPPNGTAAVFNSFSKVWAFNGNTILRAGSPARTACTMELGFINQTGVPMTDGSVPGQPYAWIYDAVALGGTPSKATVGYIARGPMFYGFQSDGPDKAFAAKNGGVEVWSVRGDSGSMEIGSTAVAATVVLDFHTSGNDNDYDSRILAALGDATAGNGYIRIDAAHLEISSAGGLHVNGQRVVGPRGAAIADTDATIGNVAATVNLILARMRASTGHGQIEG